MKIVRESLYESLDAENLYSEDYEHELTKGEQAAISKGLDILTPEQMAALYLFAKEMESRGEDLRGNRDNFLTRNAFKMNADTTLNDFRKLPAIRMADILDINPRTSNYTISKFRLLLRGQREGIPSNIIYPKILNHFDMFEKMQPAEVLSLANDAININADTKRSEEYSFNMNAKSREQREKTIATDKKIGDDIVRLYKSLYPMFGDEAAHKAISKISKERGIEEKKLRTIVKTYLSKDPVLGKKF
ncbi:hypothetical protein M0Q50_06685 [bacterium]|jgi:hypothetical protein|nr:hypothetical protein [bacterium]